MTVGNYVRLLLRWLSPSLLGPSNGRGRRGQAPPRRSNFARNSPAACSNIEFVSLELQRFREVSKNDRGKLCAKFVWRWPPNPCWPYQPAEARTAAGSRYPRALRPCPPCPGVLHAGDGGFVPCEALWQRVVGVSHPWMVQFPRRIGGGAAVHIQRTYSNAPPESGRGIVRTRDQAFCSTPCMANIRPTMIELLSAWNSHEYATFFPDITYTSVRTMLSGRYVKKSCHW